MRPSVLLLIACFPGTVSAQDRTGSERRNSATPKTALPVPVPSPLPPSPPRIRKPPHPELVAAMNAGREGEALLREGKNKQALDHFLKTLASSPRTMPSYAGNGLHLQMLVVMLANRGLADEAEQAVAAFLRRPAPGPIESHASILGRAIDFGLYFAAGRGDIGQVLSLLDRRAAIKNQLQGMCPNAGYFPVVVGPAHHDPRVATKLLALGCPQNVIAQIDNLASRPIGAPLSLPPRRRTTGGMK